MSLYICICIIFCVGIGSIRNLNFNDVEGSISWDPPQTAGVLGNMSYQLVVINNNTGLVIVNATTTLTTYYFPFEPCQVYVGQVTAHVGNIAGEAVVQQHRTISGECLSMIVLLCFAQPCPCRTHNGYECGCVHVFHI